MVRLGVGYCIVLLAVAEIATAILNNTEIEANVLQNVKTRRKDSQSSKKHRSTSSSSNSVGKNSGEDSMDLSTSSAISNTDENKKNNKYKPKSSEERKGWRKWHRKCTPCIEDMRKKWKDPSIMWICGAFQRARRSFKSLCMMHYRNCQDGTMFVKIHDHRCANSSAVSPHGDHFFYEYRAVLSDDTSNSDSGTSSESETGADSST